MTSSRILYIEDDDNNRVLVERVMLAEGYEVITARNAKHGIELAVQLVPDIILMDINMPDMDGYQATNEIRRFTQLDHVPIIAVTANVMKGAQEETLAAGCDGYIPKPIDIDRFPEEIDYFIQRGPRG